MLGRDASCYNPHSRSCTAASRFSPTRFIPHRSFADNPRLDCPQALRDKTLYVWQRLVNTGGQTCDRCSATYDALWRAIPKLQGFLGPLGLEPPPSPLDVNPAWLTASTIPGLFLAIASGFTVIAQPPW